MAICVQPCHGEKYGEGAQGNGPAGERRTLYPLRKMDIVGRLAGGLAQYFNDILAVIIGYGNYLHTQLGERDPLSSYVDEHQALCERGLSAQCL